MGNQNHQYFEYMPYTEAWIVDDSDSVSLCYYRRCTGYAGVGVAIKACKPAEYSRYKAELYSRAASNYYKSFNADCKSLLGSTLYMLYTWAESKYM